MQSLRVANQRKDFLHQVSAKLTDNNEVIVVETLKVKNMVKNRCLSRAIADVGWSKFVNFLEYKLNNKSGKLIKIDTFYPSSKTCNSCSYKNNDLTLSDRNWICINCNEGLDRDLNAAKNIRDEGLRLITAGTAEYQACGDNVRLTQVSGRQRSRKPIPNPLGLV